MPSGPTTYNDGESSDSSSSSSEHVEEEEEEESTWGPHEEEQDTESGAWHEPDESSPPDKERQLLLLMLLAQVCALHDPTPRTFTVHVLELFERGILDRESIRFLFELGLVPQQQPMRLEAEQHAIEHTNEEIANALTALTHSPKHGMTSRPPSSGNVVTTTTTTTTVTPRVILSHEHVRTKEASAIRSHLQDKAAAPSASFHQSSSWAVEHHPLSLSRYQREFQQVRLLNSGSFGHVYQATHLMDGRDYAIKRVTFRATGYSSDSVTQAIREVQCLAQCDHAHCVRYYTSWLEPSWMTGSGSAPSEQQLLLTNIQHKVGQVTCDGTKENSSSKMLKRFSFTGHAEEEEDVSEWSSSRAKDDSFLGSFPGSPKPPTYHYEICLFIQMQLCNPSTLADWIRQRNQSSTTHSSRAGPAIHIFSQLVSGIQHVHEKGILHRDLKPANVFVGDDGRFKIGDFGLSKLLCTGGRDFCEPTLPRVNKDNSRDPLTAGIGTASYAAPEQLKSRTYGPEADVFSMGLILLELFCSFGTEHERIHTFHDCRRQKLPPWLSETYPDVSSVILKCTQSDPAKRPTASDLLASHNVSHAVLKSELEKKDLELKKQQCEIEEKDRIIEDLRRQVERMNSRQDDKDKSVDNIQKVTKEMLGVIESTSFSEGEDY